MLSAVVMTTRATPPITNQYSTSITFWQGSRCSGLLAKSNLLNPSDYRFFCRFTKEPLLVLSLSVNPQKGNPGPVRFLKLRMMSCRKPPPKLQSRVHRDVTSGQTCLRCVRSLNGFVFHAGQHDRFPSIGSGSAASAAQVVRGDAVLPNLEEPKPEVVRLCKSAKQRRSTGALRFDRPVTSGLVLGKSAGLRREEPRKGRRFSSAKTLTALPAFSSILFKP